MDQHIPAVAGGFGLRVIPRRAPYWLWSDGESNALDCEVESPSHERWFAKVLPNDGGYRSKLTTATPGLDHVVDIESGPGQAAWRIETSVFRFPLVPGFVLFASGSLEGGSAFTLLGPHDSSVYFQLGERQPTPSELVITGQVMTDAEESTDASWVELEYEADGAAWSQRHDVRRVGGLWCLITLQAKAASLRECVDRSREIVSGVTATNAE